MARYILNELSFINGDLKEAGTEIEYDGVPGSNLDPVDDAAHEAKAKAEASGVAVGKAPSHSELQAKIDELTAELAEAKAKAPKPAKDTKAAKDTDANDLA